MEYFQDWKKREKTHVSTGAVKLAVVVSIEVDDVDSSTTIVLNNLIRGVVSTTSNNPGLLTSDIILDGYGIFTDVFKPNKLESTWTIAVDSFGLVGSDDDVL